MKSQTLPRVIAGVSVWAVAQVFLPPATPAMQACQDGSKADAPALVAVNAKVPCNKATLPKLEITLTRRVDPVSMVNLKKFELEKMTAVFVRANGSKRIQFSMRVVYKPGLVEAVQQMIGQKVTPLVFSVSTPPNRQVEFDPAKLRFEQGSRIWQPEVSDGVLDIFPLEENAMFGGLVTDNEMYLGIILLPAWMNPSAPITLRYGDFHCLVRFADMQIQKY